VATSLIDKIKELGNYSVTIGIQGEKGEQKKIVRIYRHGKKLSKSFKAAKAAKYGIDIKDVKREEISDELTVAEVAGWNEFGTKVDGKEIIPPRPFTRYTLETKSKEILEIAKKAINNPDTFYDVIGLYVSSEINRTISSKPFVANKPATIRWKGSSTPLVDTGQLRNALTYKVNKND